MLDLAASFLKLSKSCGFFSDRLICSSNFWKVGKVLLDVGFKVWIVRPKR